MTTRLEQLLEFLADDPNDPFNIYALALEYRKDNPQKAKELFDQLLNKHPDYVPTYYHAANLYLDLNLKEGALAIIDIGIITAQKQNEMKAMRELKALVDAFEL